MTAFPESSSAETPDSSGCNTTITACSDGPLLVRGDFELLRDDGTPIENKRSTVALCRCGRTAIAPFCDSSHKKKRARAS
ncbi:MULTISPECIES: CDGSH iron-sulfur domain-containing protein [Rhodococcus]|uniref:CDGSH iron-sulfur domain-containing protein n=1 Tax=Rhodococcus TaxID=1827 RepID=UPI001E4ADC90|nr:MULTISPECIES: CDGSH iron-sulfur domain-containing protein [Rhodococcus]MCD2107759.1 CDGSH iron-sulfur domain-containing protein [Rhodococcus qingshengii]MCZ4524791.1 CDGSH iron-sulfur domain-containing protein [Rhodococcus erythropolis]MDV8007724.1 CDGSH iron-sulfur domain-containing protein [Rhodococcus sp. IEGM 1318]MDZ7914662.1 CDGSH iron-sulfur domain-containing protein [Rhodococcus sp. (in: high G+C Gram-positive bacteria)]